LDRLTVEIVAGLKKAAEQAGVPVQINSMGSMFTVFFTALPVTDFQTSKLCNTERYSKFFHGMLNRGVYFPPSQFETCFVSLAHTQSDIKATIKAAAAALKEAAS
jgi:glutamate-1-semialdehyde 2,1-aminomutase